MKRPLFVIGVTFALATWIAFFIPDDMALQASIAFSATALLIYFANIPKLQPVYIICLAAALALGNYAYYIRQTIEPFSRLKGETLEVQGILMEKTNWGKSTAYTLQADFPGAPELPGKQRIILRSYGDFSFQVGDSVRCLVRVKLPEGPPGGSFYRARGVVMTGYLSGQVREAPGDGFRLQRSLLRLREWMRQNLYRSLSQENAQVLGAMVLGLQGEVPPEVYTAVNRSGTAHLLAVSGLHLSILTGALLHGLGRLRVPRFFRYLLAFLGALLFAGLVGFSASISRAFVMTSVTLLGRSLSRKGDGRNALGLALLLICLLRPYWVLSKSLWLSAGSTLGILMLAPKALEWLDARLGEGRGLSRRFLNMTLGAVAISLCAYVFSLPVLLATTGWVSVISPIANMLVAPFITPVILGSILCALVPGGVVVTVLSAVTNLCCFMIIGISRVLAQVPLATIAIDEAYQLLILLGGVAGAGVLVYYKADKRLVAYALALFAACGSVGHLSLCAAQRDTIELAVVEGCDVTVLLREDQAVLLGTPDRYNISSLLRYLDYRGVTRISAVFAPGYPEQIDSGLIRLRNRYTIDCVIGPDDAVLLDALSVALPDTQVVSGGYARSRVLEGALVATPAAGSDLVVEIGAQTLLKYDREYAVLTEYDREGILVFRDGTVLLPEGVPSLVEPVGRQLFGEVRVLLHI